MNHSERSSSVALSSDGESDELGDSEAELVDSCALEGLGGDMPLAAVDVFSGLICSVRNRGVRPVAPREEDY